MRSGVKLEIGEVNLFSFCILKPSLLASFLEEKDCKWLVLCILTELNTSESPPPWDLNDWEDEKSTWSS